MNEGWMCPNCGGAHAPSVQTCPMTVSTTAIIDWSPQIHVEKCLHDVPVTSRCFACANAAPQRGPMTSCGECGRDYPRGATAAHIATFHSKSSPQKGNGRGAEDGR